MGFIDQMRSQGFAVESICRVLREQGVQIAARTYRSWRNPVIAKRTITDAMVLDAVRDIVWEVEEHVDGTTRRKMTPEGLYGRKKMTAYIRRTAIADASRGAVDRAMRALGLQGITRAKAIRTTILAKDGIRAGDLLNRDFTAPSPITRGSLISPMSEHGLVGFMLRLSLTCTPNGSWLGMRKLLGTLI